MKVQGLLEKDINIIVIFVGYVGWADENAIRASKKVCSHCAKKIAIKGFDDIATKEPWMIKFFQEKDKHLVYELRRSSNKKIYPICPYCGEIRNIPFQISTIYNLHSIGCPKCSDGISYPEKFLMELFNQIGVEVLFHPTINDIPWCRPHIYDFYDPVKQVIIEANGMQHYKKVRTFAQTIEEVKKNDKIKKEKAIENGILESRYIQLDCRYSKKDYLKEKILNHTKFNVIYQLNKKEIDWDKCHEQGMMSMYIKIYNYKQEHPKITNRELSKKFYVNKDTVSKAINKIKFYKNKTK